jgi:hypothetical protein
MARVSLSAPAQSRYAQGATAMRSQPLGLLASQLLRPGPIGLGRASTLTKTQEAVTAVLRQLREAVAQASGLQGKGLLGHGDPAKVVYSVTLLERGEQMNYLRLQTDNFDQPLDINDGAKLDLGSTAKLRTLVSYLDIIANLHQRYSAMDAGPLKAIELDPKDTLSRWSRDYLAQHPGSDLADMLQAALERSYSANPAENFFTGGGLHTFSNFRREDNSRTMSVREGLRNSVNLVFVRLMRDVVHHYMFQAPGSSAGLLRDSKDPRRAEYLSRFADREGREFITVSEQVPGQPVAGQELLPHGAPTPARLASISAPSRRRPASISPNSSRKPVQGAKWLNGWQAVRTVLTREGVPGRPRFYATCTRWSCGSWASCVAIRAPRRRK